MEETFRALDAEIERSRNQIAALQARVKLLLEKRSLLKSQGDFNQLAIRENEPPSRPRL